MPGQSIPGSFSYFPFTNPHCSSNTYCILSNWCPMQARYSVLKKPGAVSFFRAQPRQVLPPAWALPWWNPSRRLISSHLFVPMTQKVPWGIKLFVRVFSFPSNCNTWGPILSCSQQMCNELLERSYAINFSPHSLLFNSAYASWHLGCTTHCPFCSFSRCFSSAQSNWSLWFMACSFFWGSLRRLLDHSS